MSVFGGDSWAREAQYRKRRVDDFIVEGLDGSSYKKLSSGKFACLVCPGNPVLDSPLMLSMHFKGSGHRSAEARLKERELKRRDEMNKRIALCDSTVASGNYATSKQKLGAASKPLIQQTKKAALEVLDEKNTKSNPKNVNCEMNLHRGLARPMTFDVSQNHSLPASEGYDNVVVPQHLSFQDRRERELKFTAAGWKRDCHGKWYRDENVEFDSDEEDPNVSWLNQ